MQTETIRVLLVDDHAIMRHGLRAILEADGGFTVVGEADSVSSAKVAAVKHRPHVALIGARLPDGSGVEVVHHLHSEAPQVRALMLSSSDDEDTILDAFAAGVSGYVLNQIDPADLVTGVRDVAEGKSLVAPEIAARMMERMRRQHEPDSRELLSNLSPQEMRILELIGDGMTNREIGERLFLSEKTIKNNVTSLLSKLNVQRRMQAATLLSRTRR